MRLFLLIVCTALTSCASRAQTQRIAQLEKRAEDAEQRLAAIEAKTALMDAVIDGVNQLLERLSGVGPGPTGPDPLAIYSVPVEDSPFDGPEHAPVTMVQAFDFYCGYCNQVRPVLAVLRSEYGDKLKIVYKHFVIHDDVSRLPALASCAASLQGRFMDMFRSIWENGLEARHELEESDLLTMATALGLNRGQLKRDMYDKCEATIARDQQQLTAVGTTGTPAFYINGRFLAGARPIDDFRELINEELGKANKAIDGGVPLRDYYPGLVKSGKSSL